MSVPRHVAIILDGNGRWAKAKGLPRTAGHTAGAKNVEVVCEEAYNMGIEYLTLYAFSTENWNRSKEEVTALMNLLNQYLKNCLKTAKKNNMRIRVIGDISRLDPSMQEKICLLEKESASYTGLNLTIAINYGSRDEIVRGIKRMYQDVEEHKLDADAISEDTVSKYLDTADLPDPDLMIRTSGEQRLSNYLLWQLAYAEFYFTPVAWPDFHGEELRKAVEAYENRDRRYGKV
ncbi:isoprenyl transferase [Roseburia sp. AM51-8]|jgi:undecaprenyl diphosphate synthase|uniref:Isoprenyl transferase n=2 Tax=Lachnospiraceae TaxID=186803 RepID=A0ABR7GCU4_9FIRM|nr:isoprenyl transferase [Roseburia lenta]MDY3871732.1 isoprenyl transferase [Roseburia lenta]RHO32083.1 isoprenyl transferase [Roseburia sp. AM16-25]RHQ02399.1 isoprenyl transferase [Roseburia sp. AM51-8]